MNPRKGLVLDANILMRAVLGRRVRELMEACEDLDRRPRPIWKRGRDMDDGQGRGLSESRSLTQ